MLTEPLAGLGVEHRTQTEARACTAVRQPLRRQFSLSFQSIARDPAPRGVVFVGHRGAPDREARPGASPILLGKARVPRGDPLSPGFIGPIWTQFNRLSTWIQPVVHSDSTGCPRWPRQDAPPTASTRATRVSLNDHVAGCFKPVSSTARDRFRCSPRLWASGSTAA